MQTASCRRRLTQPTLAFSVSLGLTLINHPSALRAQQSTPTPVITATDPYRSARTPAVTLTLDTSIEKKGLAAKLAKLTALGGGDVPTTPGLIQPQVHGGVFDEVSLGYLDGSSQTAAPAAITLQFDAARAGASVWVQPLDGGAILTKDADGKPISSSEGCNVVVDTSGKLAFGYQALARPGRYQVLIRLDNISSILPFVILDPSVDN